MKNKMIVICLIFFMLISISAVSAENNNSDVITIENDYNDTISINNLNDNEILSANPGSFVDLNTKINGGSSASIELNQDYVYSSSDTIKQGIVINKDNMVIDGKGHTIDAKGQSRIFYVNSTSVYLKNIKFVNGFASDGGAVYGYGDNLRVINCTFVDNKASGWGGAIFSYPYSYSAFVNSTFTNNNAKNGGAVSAYNYISSYDDDFTIYGNRHDIVNCTFDSNTATDDGGALAIMGQLKSDKHMNDDRVNIMGCIFTNNNAPQGDAISNMLSAYINMSDSVILGSSQNVIYSWGAMFFADNNWWGNTYDNKSANPKIDNNIKVDTWLYMDMVADLASSSATISINNLYDKITGETSNYATSKFPPMVIDVDADNSTIDVDKVILDSSGNGKFDFNFINDTILTASYPTGSISKKVKGGSFTDLQRIINAADDGDTIVLDKDYVYIKGVDIITQGISVSDKHDLVIDGNGHSVNADGNSRVFVTDMASNNIVFKNIIIANGFTDASLAGSGLDLQSDNSQLINCTFINNKADTTYGGAALYVDASHLTIDGCRFISNTHLFSTAGAMLLRGYDLTVKNTLFENNTAAGFAGAIESYDECDIINCTFRNNSAPYAGATYNYGHANIIDCTFIGNRAIDDGSEYSGMAGAVYAINTTITNCVFTYNEANLGAAITIFSTEASVDKSIFINNTGGYNGAICSLVKGGKVSNSIFLNNDVGSNDISCIYDGIVVEYCWFGNIWYNNQWSKYDTVPPVSNLAKLNNWLFLNATDFTFDEKGNLKVAFTFLEYDNATKQIIQYDVDELPGIDLKLSSQNLTLNKNVVNVGQTIEGTSTYYKGALYAEYENVKYEVSFKHQIPTSIEIDSTINIFKDEVNYIYFNITPFDEDYIPFLINNNRLSITNNDSSVVSVEKTAYNIKVKGLKTGSALLTLNYNGLNAMGEEKYLPSNATVLVTVTRIPTHIEFTYDVEDMGIGESGTIYVSARDYKNKSVSGSSLEYINNNESVIRLAYNSFRTLNEGLANVTVKFAGNDKYEPCSLDVTFNVGKKPVTITVDTDELELYVGQYYYLGLGVKEISGAMLNCSSNDTNVAVFTDDNAVYAVGKGVANLTIRFDGNDKYKLTEKHVIVKVIDFETYIDVEPEKELNITDNGYLYHVLKDASGKSISVPIAQGDQLTKSYISNDTSVVTVDESGYITAVGVGVANVTIKFNGYMEYQPSSASVIVKVTIPTNAIIVKPIIDLHVGEYSSINATLEHKPFNFKSSDLIYDVNDTNVVHITTAGYLTGYSEGTAKITIIYNASNKYEPCNATVIVKVTKGNTKITAPESISLHVDETQKINANLTSIWENKNITGIKYESSNNKVAKVDRYGLITAVGVGQANITLKYDGSNKYYGDSTIVLVTVDYLPTEIDVGNTFVLFLDQSDNLNAILNPSDIGSLIYESSNENIVKVDNGIITAVGVGQANISVIFNGTKKYAPASQIALVTVYPLDIPTNISANESIELSVYDSTDVGAVLTPSNAGDLIYISSNESIVKVDGNGVITAVGVGQAIVTIKFEGNEGRFLPSNATMLVKVNKIASEIIAEDSISLFIDVKENIDAVLTPDGAGNLIYVSSNSSVVDVDDNGVVTGVNIGEAIITVRYIGDANHIPSSKNITVTVNKVSTKIDADKTFALIIGANATLNSVLTPSQAGNLTYVSSDESVVSVDDNGVVTALKIGETNVTVSFKGTNKYAPSSQVVLVTVYASEIPTSISVNNTIELDLYNSTDVGAVLTPSNAGDLTYTSSDESIVKIDSNGVVTGVGIGRANITIKFKDENGKFLPSNATVLVIVNRIATEITAKDSVSLFIDETESIDAILNPVNAGSLTYASSNESIVKVDGNGLITAVGSGEANITVRYSGSDKYLSSSKNISVSVNKLSAKIDVGKTFILFIDGRVNVDAVLTPSNAGELSYASSDESIVEVDDDGIIIAVGVGNATVTVIFNGTEKYSPTSENVSITVKSLDISTNIAVNDSFDLCVGDEIDVGAVLSPSNAGNLTYQSSNESVVKVTDDGLIIAVGVGEANVTIEFAGVNGKFLKSQAKTAVKVSAIPTTITADSSITLNLTENSTIKYVFSHPEAGNVEFIIDNPNIISINNGVIIANNVGKTNLTILFKGNEKYIASNAVVLVNVVDVATVIEASDIVVNVTERGSIGAKLTPNVGKLIYESTNSSVVSVDANGVVTGVAVGEADIIIKFAATGKYHQSNKTITVRVLDVETVIDASDVTVNVTQRGSIGAKLTPNVGKLVYESTNSSVVSVDANGMILGLKIGEANITISFAGIGKYKSANKTITVRVLDVETVIDASDVTVNVTERGSIDAKLTPNVGKLSYESTNSSIVTVDNNGGIKGISIGEADIIIKFAATGKYREANKTVHVKVVGVPTQIKVNNTVSLFVDDTANINAVLTPKTLGKLTYGTNDSLIVSIDENGKITANKEGSAIITVSYAGEGKYLPSNATVEVKVSRIPTNITVNDIDFELGEGKYIKTTLSPIFKNTNLTYSSNDSSVFEIDDKGFASAVSGGKALITIIYPGNDKYLPSNLTFIITITSRITSIDVEKSIELGLNENRDLGARVSTKYTYYDLPLTYESSNPSIVSVDENGIITANKMGNATITIKFAGEKSFAPSNATVNVVVTTKTTEVKVPNNHISVYVDDEVKIDASLVGGPQNAKLSYQSSSPGIVSVDSTGKIKANGQGSAIITVRYDGDEECHSSEATINVTVSKIATKIVVDNKFEMKVFETIELSAVLTPQKGIMTYTSSDDEIASVDASGKLKAKTTGNVVVTIKFAGDRKYLASQKQVIVTISKIPTSINASDITLYSGDEFRLQNVLTPSEAPARYLTFESWDMEIFDVDKNGVITTFQEGVAELYMEYKGNDAYLPSNATVIVKVIKKTLTADDCRFDIDVSDDEGKATFTLTVPDDAEGTFLVNVDGDFYGESIEDGIATITVDELVPGDYKVTMRYSGDEKYSSINNYTTIHIYRIKIDKNKDVSVVYTENAVYKVHLTSDTQAMENKTVTFNVNGKTYYGKTDMLGYASVKLPKLAAKEYTITASYKGIKVTNKIISKHIVVAKNLNAKKTKALKVKVTLNKVNKKYLAKKKVTLKFNGKKYTAKTNNKGVVTFTIAKSVLAKLKVGKSYTYKVTYSKDTVSKKIKIVK